MAVVCLHGYRRKDEQHVADIPSDIYILKSRSLLSIHSCVVFSLLVVLMKDNGIDSLIHSRQHLIKGHGYQRISFTGFRRLKEASLKYNVNERNSKSLHQ